MNAATLCSHGRSGYCHDDATPEQRKDFESLYAHAYTWAADVYDMQRDHAEAYASWFAQRWWGDPEPYPHSLELPDWLKEAGLTEAEIRR